MNNSIILALTATLGTWALTALGAAVVIFFKKPKQSILNLMLGFLAGYSRFYIWGGVYMVF